MRNLFALLALALTLTAATSAQAANIKASEAPGAHPLAVGTAFPDVPLIGTPSPEAAASLGLAPNGANQPLSKVSAEVLVVEIFSMYCPFCQNEAPNMNALFSLIDKRGLGNRIKVIGIGAGNSDTEVDVFRKKFDVPFPLFSDAAFAVHQRIGQVGTPFFYVLKKKPNQGYEIIHASLGQFGSPEEFLSVITRAAGI